MLLRSEVSDGSRPPDSSAHPVSYPRVCALRNLLGERPKVRIKAIADFNWHVHQIVPSPDGAHFVVHGKRGTDPTHLERQTRVYRTDGAFVAQLPTSLPSGEESGFSGFDPSGRLLMYDLGRRPVIIELPTCRLVGSPPIIDVLNFAIAQDARLWLIQPSGDHRANMCDRGGNVLLHQLWDQATSQNSSFSPDLDGRYVLWGDASGTVYVADLVEIQRTLTGLRLGW
jgi:hypothetical protein